MIPMMRKLDIIKMYSCILENVIVCLFVGSYSQGVEYWIKSDPYLPSKLLEYLKKYIIQ